MPPSRENLKLTLNTEGVARETKRDEGQCNHPYEFVFSHAIRLSFVGLRGEVKMDISGLYRR